MTWTEWPEAYRRRLRAGIAVDCIPVPACKPPKCVKPAIEVSEVDQFKLLEDDCRFLSLVDEHYDQTIDLVKENLPLVAAVRYLFTEGGEQLNFNAGLQLGAMLVRGRSDAAGNVSRSDAAGADH